VIKRLVHKHCLPAHRNRRHTKRNGALLLIYHLLQHCCNVVVLVYLPILAISVANSTILLMPLKLIMSNSSGKLCHALSHSASCMHPLASHSTCSNTCNSSSNTCSSVAVAIVISTAYRACYRLQQRSVIERYCSVALSVGQHTWLIQPECFAITTNYQYY
jgi:hypothetical protein